MFYAGRRMEGIHAQNLGTSIKDAPTECRSAVILYLASLTVCAVGVLRIKDTRRAGHRLVIPLVLSWQHEEIVNRIHVGEQFCFIQS